MKCGLVTITFAAASSLLPMEDEMGMLAVATQRESLAGHLAVASQTHAQQIVTQMIGTRNVTNMVALIQELANEHVHGDALTQELRDLIAGIELLVDDIQKALKDEHATDEAILDGLESCWTDANATLKKERDIEAVLKKKNVEDKKKHQTCREDLFNMYVDKIEKCTAYDDFIANLRVPHVTVEQECVWGQKKDTVHQNFKTLTEWVQNQEIVLEEKYEQCADAVTKYDNASVQCDKVQAEYEDDVCSTRESEWNSCFDNYMTACSTCSANFDSSVSEMECREKDRKIDWSASEKIRCYLTVLAKSPSDYNISESCVQGESCLSDKRIAEYKLCEKLCENVDYDGDGYDTVNGTNTTHRLENEKIEKRCTRPMDLDFPAKSGCEPCPALEPFPCERAWMEEYEDFQQETWIKDLDKDTKQCQGYKHMESFAYSMNECRKCTGNLPSRDKLTPEEECQNSGGQFGNEIIVEYKLPACSKQWTQTSRDDRSYEHDYCQYDYMSISNFLVNGDHRPSKVDVSSEYAQSYWMKKAGYSYNKENTFDTGSQCTFWRAKYKSRYTWANGKRQEVGPSRPIQWASFKLSKGHCIKDIKISDPKEVCKKDTSGSYGQKYQHDGGALQVGLDLGSELTVRVLSSGVVQWTSPAQVFSRNTTGMYCDYYWNNGQKTGDCTHAYQGTRGSIDLEFKDLTN